VRAVAQRLTEPGESAVVDRPLPGHDDALLSDDRIAALKPLRQALAGHARDLQGAFAALATQVTNFATGFSELGELVRAGEAPPQAGPQAGPSPD